MAPISTLIRTSVGPGFGMSISFSSAPGRRSVLTTAFIFPFTFSISSSSSLLALHSIDDTHRPVHTRHTDVRFTFGRSGRYTKAPLSYNRLFALPDPHEHLPGLAVVPDAVGHGRDLMGLGLDRIGTIEGPLPAAVLYHLGFARDDHHAA